MLNVHRCFNATECVSRFFKTQIGTTPSALSLPRELISMRPPGTSVAKKSAAGACTALQGSVSLRMAASAAFESIFLASGQSSTTNDELAEATEIVAGAGGAGDLASAGGWAVRRLQLGSKSERTLAEAVTNTKA